MIKFIPSTPVLLLAAILMGAMAGSWLTYKVVRGGEIRALNAALKAQGAILAEYELTLADRENKRRVALREAADWRKRWEDAQNDPIIQEWADTALPAAVVDRVRELSSGKDSD